jgi:hypothetical protein
MAPPSLDPPSKCALHAIAEGVPQSIPGRNKSCTATYPDENQRPTARSINQHEDNWRVDDGTYDGTYDDSLRGLVALESRSRFTPYYKGRYLEEHAPLPYGHHPSYRFSLYVAPRHLRISFKDAFEDVSTFQDAFRHEFKKVTYFVFLWKKIKTRTLIELLKKNPHPH